MSRDFPKSRSVLEMSAAEAREYFLKPRNYFTEPLPPFITFDQLLKELARIDPIKLKKLFDKKPKNIPEKSELNYIIYHNQDGRYAWRAFHFINPVLYVNLVNLITEESHWQQIKKRFAELSQKADRIRPLGLPLASQEHRVRDRGAEIKNWIEEVEQETLRLALKYQYLYHTDIAKFYPSIYTHTIAWALHGREEAKNKRRKKILGNLIDKSIRDMQEGQSNGIPIGSALMNLIAEIILRWADSLVQEEARNNGVSDFLILRYRDDYRIFVNREQDGDKLLKVISEVLQKLGLYLNERKTDGPLSPVEGALKPDKIAWLQRNCRYRNLQKRLLLIYEHSLEFPNGGSLVGALIKVLRQVEKSKNFCTDPETCVGILTEIAFKNPRVFHLCISIISQVIQRMIDQGQKSQACDMVALIGKRLEMMSNSEYAEIWYKSLLLLCKCNFNHRESICKIVNEENVALWKMDWIGDSDEEISAICQKIPQIIIKEEFINRLRPIVVSDVSVFDAYPL